LPGEHLTSSSESSDSAENPSPLSQSPVKEKSNLINMEYVPQQPSSIRSSINSRTIVAHPNADKDITPIGNENFMIVPKVIKSFKKTKNKLSVKRHLEMSKNK